MQTPFNDRTYVDTSRIKHFIRKLPLFHDFLSIVNDVANSLKHRFYSYGSDIDSSIEFQVLFDGSIKDKETGKILGSPIKILRGNFISTSDCHISYIENENYKKLKESLVLIEQNKLIDYFLSLPVFAKWNRASIMKIIKATKLITYKVNETVYLPDTYPKYIYIVKSGEYSILKRHTDIITKKTYLENYLGPPRERERRRLFYEHHFLKCKNVGANSTTERTILLVY